MEVFGTEHLEDLGEQRWEMLVLDSNSDFARTTIATPQFRNATPGSGFISL
jgi:hypothetical protein